MANRPPDALGDSPHLIHATFTAPRPNPRYTGVMRYDIATRTDRPDDWRVICKHCRLVFFHPKNVPGRIPQYHSQACKQAAYRNRRIVKMLKEAEASGR